MNRIMNLHGLTRSLLLGALALPIGCSSDDVADDEVASETSTDAGTDSTSSTGSTETEGEGSTSSDASTDATSTDATSTDATTTDATTTDPTTDTTDSTDTTDGEPIMCPDVFPEFGKACAVDSDCAVVVHTTDCCGNSVAWGISADEAAAFEAAEAICDSQYPQCDCPAGPTVAEDGNEAFGLDSLAVSCEMGSCMSYVLMP